VSSFSDETAQVRPVGDDRPVMGTEPRMARPREGAGAMGSGAIAVASAPDSRRRVLSSASDWRVVSPFENGGLHLQPPGGQEAAAGA